MGKRAPATVVVRDDCTDSIRNFWSESNLQSHKDFYPDPGGFHRCTVCTKTFSRSQDLKTHRTRQKHREKKSTIKTKTKKTPFSKTHRHAKGSVKGEMGRAGNREFVVIQISRVDF